MATGWENFYGLGYYDIDGRAYLTTWSGDRPVVRRLSLNCAPLRIPLWRAPVPDGARLVPVPPDAHEVLRLMQHEGARIVIGWEVETPIERESPNSAREHATA